MGHDTRNEPSDDRSNCFYEHTGFASNPSFFAYEDLISNYWELYPRGEDVVIKSIAPLNQGVGLTITLRSTLPGFSHFLYSIDGAKERESKDGIIALACEDGHTLEDYSVERRELVEKTRNAFKQDQLFRYMRKPR